jgi:hypothetical protein
LLLVYFKRPVLASTFRRTRTSKFILSIGLLPSNRMVRPLITLTNPNVSQADGRLALVGAFVIRAPGAQHPKFVPEVSSLLSYLIAAPVKYCFFFLTAVRVCSENLDNVKLGKIHRPGTDKSPPIRYRSRRVLDDNTDPLFVGIGTPRLIRTASISKPLSARPV